MIHRFKAILEKARDGIDAVFISIPFDVEKLYGTRGQLKIKATFDGHPYRGTLVNMGTGCHLLGVRKDIRHAIGKKPGEVISVTIEKDTEERVVAVPDELQQILDKNPKAKSFYESLSFTNRKEYVQWISSAKKQETKNKRLAEILSRLLKGKKNPSEK
jgi:Domain of unknown function (DUF1905)/Bacteriocin-protection, YdeI or OmpD-Associated